MVDFRKENASLYIPKNFSYDSQNFRRYYEDSLYLQAICELSKGRSSTKDHAAFSAANNTAAVLHEKNINSTTTTSQTHLLHERSVSSFTALDLASITKNNCGSYSSKSNTLLSKSNESKWTKMGDSVVTDTGVCSNSDTNGVDTLPENKDILKSVVSLRSQSLASDTDTDFSEDYMRMTDSGDSASARSDTPDSLTRTDRCGSTSSYDSTLSFSNTSNAGTIDEDLDRVTVTLPKTMELSPDDPVKKMKDQLENDAFLVQKGVKENTNKTLGLASKRLKEKELPKIKLLLSKSLPTADVFDKGLPSIPTEEANNHSEDSTPPPTSGSLFVNQEFDFLETEHVKRSTSLKTYKTPPGTPHRKKVVRFADAMGLDLEDVKHVMNTEDPPNIPDSAMKDLKVGLEEEHKTEGTKYLRTCFPQPGANPNFIQLVMDTKVKLENCMVDGREMTINGTVRVANVSFHKRVVVRYTVNNWTTFTDVFASYVQNSNDGATDRFSFTVGVPNYFQNGNKIDIAVMLESNGQQYWDNNGGSNYSIECYAAAVPVTESDNLWMQFL